jgi:hypothetical protein
MPLLSLSQTLALGLEAAYSRLVAATAGIPCEALAREPTRDILAKAALGLGLPDGTAPAHQPQLTLRISQMVEEYARINATLLARKSPAQLKK